MFLLQKACCCIPLRTGTLILGWGTLAMGVLGVGITAVELRAIPPDIPHRDAVVGITAFEVFLYSLLSLGLACLIHGVYTNQPAYVAPLLVFSLFEIIGGIILIIMAVFNGLPPQYRIRNFDPVVLLSMGNVSGIYAAIVGWSYFRSVRQTERNGPMYA